jgi:secreted trypsin-like serine protease
MRVLRIGLVAAALVAGLLVTARPSQAIVGGTNVPAGAYPFMASVQSNNSHFCGGSVISSTWVLTAAHCVPNGSAAGLSVVVGTNTNNNSSGFRRTVAEVRVHPLYGGNSVFDAALLRLATAVPTSVTPITLANAPADDNLEADGTPVTVAGWGDVNPVTMGLLAPATLKEAQLNVVGDQQCMASTTSTEAITTVCAQAFGKDSCQGDSGGPLFAKIGAQRIQIGVVSRGFLCAVPQNPGMYSEVNNGDIRGFISANAGV